MRTIEVGDKSQYSQDPPESPFTTRDGELLYSFMPPHEISLYLKSPTFFIAMQNGRSKGKISYDSDVMRDFEWEGGEYMMGRADQEFAVNARSYSGLTVVHYSEAFLDRLDLPGGMETAMRNARPLGEDRQLRHLMTALCMSLQDGRDAPLYREHLATAVAMRFFTPGKSETGRSRTSQPHATDAGMRRAEEYMRANMCENVSLEDIAEAAGMSSTYFWKSFKAWKGVTPHAHLTDMRLDKARRLLHETDMSVLRIAFECGYNHQSHFGQTFKARFGVSPSQYRRSAS